MPTFARSSWLRFVSFTRSSIATRREKRREEREIEKNESSRETRLNRREEERAVSVHSSTATAKYSQTEKKYITADEREKNKRKRRKKEEEREEEEEEEEKKNSKSRIGVNQRKTETVSERRNRSSSYNLLHSPVFSIASRTRRHHVHRPIPRRIFVKYLRACRIGLCPSAGKRGELLSRDQSRVDVAARQAGRRDRRPDEE